MYLLITVQHKRITDMDRLDELWTQKNSPGHERRLKHETKNHWIWIIFDVKCCTLGVHHPIDDPFAYRLDFKSLLFVIWNNLFVIGSRIRPRHLEIFFVNFIYYFYGEERQGNKTTIVSHVHVNRVFIYLFLFLDDARPRDSARFGFLFFFCSFHSFLNLYLSGMGAEWGEERNGVPLCNVLIIAAQCPYFVLFSRRKTKFGLFRVFQWNGHYRFRTFSVCCMHVSLTQHSQRIRMARISIFLFGFHFVLCLDRVTSVCPAHIKIFEKKLKPEMMKLIMFFSSFHSGVWFCCWPFPCVSWA